MAKLRPSSKEYRKEKARRNLLDFILYTKPDYQVNWHHKVVCEYYERWAFGDINRLMLFMPPQNGKTEIVSRRGPAWILGRNPDAKFISCSYGASLASSINRDVQRIIDSPEYRELFPETVIFGKNIRTTAQGSYLRNSDIFEVVGHAGRYFCSGVGGGISGQPMTHGNIDDPLRGRKDAESPAIRGSIWGWFNGDFYSRQGKNAKILLTVTRWNEDDLPGRLIKLQEEDPNADQWTILKFPAIAESPIPDYDLRLPGEALWPDRYPSEHLQKVRALSEYDWQSLYQQNPRNDQFAIFNPDKMRLVDISTVDLARTKFYGALDPSEGGQDYAAIITLAVIDGNFWLVWDCDLTIDTQSKSIDKLIDLHSKYHYSSFFIEANSLGHAKSAPGESLFEIELRKRQEQKGVVLPYRLIWNTQNKVDRIRSLEPHYANGQLCFRSDWAKTYHELINQMRIFPDKNAHDDGPDALEMAVNNIMMGSTKISIPQKAIKGAGFKPKYY